MPTRLVVWNVNRFSNNKVNKTTGNDFTEQLANMLQSARNTMFLKNIAATADIFVVIEVQSGRSVLGSLISGQGEQGTIYLLNWLRFAHNNNWCVVPPLKLVGVNDAGETNNYTEGIAVFFRNDNVNFTGPYVWPNNGNVAVRPGNAVTAGAYPDPWANALPNNNFSAGQFEFFKNPQNGTGDFDYISGNYRRPFLTTFTEVVGGRVIKLMTVHPSPNATKIAVVNSLAQVVEIQPSGSPEVVVVAGDFNINLKSNKTTESQGYWSLSNVANFTRKIGPTNAGTNGVTTVQQIKDATPGSYLTNLAIDNIFVRYDGGLNPPVNNPRIINPVTGTDEYPLQMDLSIAQINQNYATAPARADAFREVTNYGHIGHFAGVSDHLPLVIDI